MVLAWAGCMAGACRPPAVPEAEADSPACATPVLPTTLQLSANVQGLPGPEGQARPDSSLVETRPLESAAAAPFEPLASADELVDLPIADGNPAVVSLPLGSTGPRPLLVVTHGAGGSPRTHCERWRAIVGDRGFILCTAGSRIYPYGPDDPDARFFYNGHPALGAEIDRALVALTLRFGERVDRTDPIFAGFSQGASMGSMVLPRHPAHFARAALVEGGFGRYQEWNIAAAQRFHEQGGERVLLVCGRVVCLEHARTTESYLRQGGLEVQVVYARGAGHTWGDIMDRHVAAAFPWLIEGDARW